MAGDEEDARPGPAGVPLGTVAGVAVVAVGFVAGLARLHDNSFLTHLATGRLIRADGIPRVDPYSFTAPGEPWVVQSWLPSWVYASLEEWFGLDAIRVLTAVLVAAVVGTVWMATRGARTLAGRLLVTVVAVAALVGFVAERPLLVGLLGVALCVLACEGRLAPWVLVPFGWVWVNSHGSFPIGVAVCLVVAAGCWLDRRRGDATGPDPVVPLRAAAWLTGGVLLGALNPLGPRLLLFPLELSSRTDVLRGFVVEWQPPDFGSGSEKAFLVLSALVVVSLALRPSWRAAVVTIAFVGAALYSRRNIPIAVLVLVPVIAAALPALGSLTGEERRRWNGALAAVLVAVALVVSTSALRSPSVALGAYPIEELDLLDSYGAGGTEGGPHLLAPDYVGNLITARHGAGSAVFVDDRYDMYPRSVLEDYVVLHTLPRDPSEVLDRHDVDVVLWRADQPLAQWLGAAAGWLPGPVDDDWTIWCREGTAVADEVC